MRAVVRKVGAGIARAFKLNSRDLHMMNVLLKLELVRYAAYTRMFTVVGG